MDSFYILIAALIILAVCVILISVLGFSIFKLNRRTSQNEQIIEETMQSFMGFIDAKDQTTNGHSKRVATYTRLLAKRMGFKEEECERMYYIGLMHDCGKIGIPDAVLNKPDRLTDEEYEIIKKHTTIGGNILKNFTSIEGIQDGALYHHERYDGSGYPQGLKGENIPLIGRMICVCDSFDVMNSERCYTNKMTKEDIFYQLSENRGVQFDPKIVDVFIGMLQDGTIKF